MLTEILQLMKEVRSLSVDMIAEKLGANKETVLAALEQLRHMGYLRLESAARCGSASGCKGCSGCAVTVRPGASGPIIYTLI
ncbi:MAG: FeoC like transcriptional regulator [Clostridiales bacterium]|jgi:predicted transcriptional regulator|nr:FeoC like transcriptional regulator [Clostridiales bacterium]